MVWFDSRTASSFRCLFLVAGEAAGQGDTTVRVEPNNVASGLSPTTVRVEPNNAASG